MCGVQWQDRADVIEHAGGAALRRLPHHTGTSHTHTDRNTKQTQKRRVVSTHYSRFPSASLPTNAINPSSPRLSLLPCPPLSLCRWPVCACRMRRWATTWAFGTSWPRSNTSDTAHGSTRGADTSRPQTLEITTSTSHNRIWTPRLRTFVESDLRGRYALDTACSK